MVLAWVENNLDTHEALIYGCGFFFPIPAGALYYGVFAVSTDLHCSSRAHLLHDVKTMWMYKICVNFNVLSD